MQKLKVNQRILDEIRNIENGDVKKFLTAVWSNELSHPVYSEVFRYNEDYSSILDNIIKGE